MEEIEKLEIPWKNVSYWDLYVILYGANSDLIEDNNLLTEFSRMFWHRFKKEMTDEDIELLLDNMEDWNYHRQRKVLMEMLPIEDEELSEEEKQIEWVDIKYYYFAIFQSQYYNNVDEEIEYDDYIWYGDDAKARIEDTGYYMNCYNTTSENEEERIAAITPFVEMFWNKYKDQMSTIDIELLLDCIYYNFSKDRMIYKILYGIVKKDNRETKQHIPIDAFKDENIQGTIDEYIDKYGYYYDKFMEEMFKDCEVDEIVDVLKACGLNPCDYKYGGEEEFEIARNYFMNEYRREK